MTGKQESILDALEAANRQTPKVVVPHGDTCPHCQARDALAADLIARLADHTGTYYFTDEEADELISAVDFMRAEGYW